MKYELVLLFESAINYDELVDLEDNISECLGDIVEVDGHQISRDQVKIWQRQLFWVRLLCIWTLLIYLLACCILWAEEETRNQTPALAGVFHLIMFKNGLMRVMLLITKYIPETNNKAADILFII